MKSRLPTDPYRTARNREGRYVEYHRDIPGLDDPRATAVQDRDSVTVLLHLLTRLANCGMDAGAPPLLQAHRSEVAV